MKFITIKTGYTTDSSDNGFGTSADFRAHFDKLTLDMPNLSFVWAGAAYGDWDLEVETSKKDLIELLARIEADTISQSVDMKDINAAAADIWAARLFSDPPTHGAK